MLRMKISDLTYEILQEIVKIYDKTVGGHGSSCMYPGELNNVLNDIQKYGFADRRYGSRFTSQSKLLIKRDLFCRADPVIFFSFDFNSSFFRSEGLKLEKKFEEAVDEFLKQKGLAI